MASAPHGDQVARRRPLRVVCYAVNGSGLGHVTRLMAIARWLRRLETLVSGVAPEVLFLTSTEATSLLSDANFAAFKLPSKGVARAAGLDVLEHRRLAKHFVWQMLATMAPDLLLVDTFPQGSFDELLPVLDGPFKKVLVLRDVKPEFGARPIFQAALRLYDHVIVPHAESDAHAHVLPSERPATWVGDVLSVDAGPDVVGIGRGPADSGSPVAATRRQLRAELGLSEGRKLVYVSAGGGGDPGSEAALKALIDALSERSDVHLLVGAGPLYRGRRFTGPHLTWFTEPGVTRFFVALDAALSAGGYNTVHELLHLGVPTAFFAQAKIADQQAERIARIAALRAGRHLVELTSPQIRDALDALLRDGEALASAARKLVPHNGARLAAAHALAVLPGHDRDAILGAAELLTPRLALMLEAQGPIGGELLAFLGQLDPSPGLSALGARAALEPLLPQLSAEARAEVVAALHRRSANDERRAVEAAFVALLECAQARDAMALLPGLIQAALKKHPRAQELDPSSAHWAVGLLTELARVIEASAFQLPERLALYRVFPRLADTPLREAFATFHALLAAQRGSPFELVQRRLQALKLQRRVVAQSMAPLIAGPLPGAEA